MRRDRVFKAKADDPQLLNFPSCSQGESKLINTDTQVKFPYFKCVRLVGVGSVRMVIMAKCPPMDSGGLTVSKVNVHTEFNQYYVQFQETIKIYAHYIQHLHALCSTRQNTVKFRT